MKAVDNLIDQCAIQKGEIVLIDTGREAGLS